MKSNMFNEAASAALNAYRKSLWALFGTPSVVVHTVGGFQLTRTVLFDPESGEMVAKDYAGDIILDHDGSCPNVLFAHRWEWAPWCKVAMSGAAPAEPRADATQATKQYVDANAPAEAAPAEAAEKKPRKPRKAKEPAPTAEEAPAPAAEKPAKPAKARKPAKAKAIHPTAAPTEHFDPTVPVLVAMAMDSPSHAAPAEDCGPAPNHADNCPAPNHDGGSSSSSSYDGGSSGGGSSD